MRGARTASWMLAAGLDPLEVSYQLGHSKPSTTLDTYGRFRLREHSDVDPYDVALTTWEQLGSRA